MCAFEVGREWGKVVSEQERNCWLIVLKCMVGIVLSCPTRWTYVLLKFYFVFFLKMQDFFFKFRKIFLIKLNSFIY